MHHKLCNCLKSHYLLLLIVIILILRDCNCLDYLQKSCKYRSYRRNQQIVILYSRYERLRLSFLYSFDLEKLRILSDTFHYLQNYHLCLVYHPIQFETNLYHNQPNRMQNYPLHYTLHKLSF